MLFVRFFSGKIKLKHPLFIIHENTTSFLKKNFFSFHYFFFLFSFFKSSTIFYFEEIFCGLKETFLKRWPKCRSGKTIGAEYKCSNINEQHSSVAIYKFLSLNINLLLLVHRVCTTNKKKCVIYIEYKKKIKYYLVKRL